MKTSIILILFCGSLYASDITNTGTSVVTNKDLVTKATTNGFDIQFALTQGNVIFTQLGSPYPPRYSPISAARRGSSIYTVLVFTGAGLRSDGTADVTFDAVIRKPDGSIYGQDNNIVGVQGRIDPSPKILQLAREDMGFFLESKAPVGEYTAEVIVRDNVKNCELHAKRSFTVEK